MGGATGRRIWGILAFGVLSVAGLAAAQVVLPSQPEPSAVAPERAAQPVRVSVVSFAASGRTASYTGTLRPQHEVALGFRLQGKVVERLVGVGDRVTTGQLVARLDDTDAQLEFDRAAAEVEAARVDLDRARADRARAETLFAAGHVAQAALDRSISGEAQAGARSEAAARALDLARNRLDYTRLLADADGIVTATQAETGEVVGAGQPIIHLARTDGVDAVFALPEQDRAGFAARTAEATLWGVAGKSYALTPRDISPDVDPAGRTYRVRMTLDSPDAETVLGRTVTVTVALAEERPSARVPLSAVLNAGDGASVWRLDAGGTRVERVPVELVSIGAEVALIRGALAEGDRIVSLGAHKVDPARPVRIVETHATPES